MNCPYCNCSQIVKNGHAPSKKTRWKCKKCNKTFSKDSGKGYPPTSNPFEFVALILYRKRHFDELYKRPHHHFPRYTNLLLKMINHKPVSRYTVYSWIRKYDNSFMDIISSEEAINWLSKQQRKNIYLHKKVKKKIRTKTPKQKSKELDEIEQLLFTQKDFLNWCVEELGFKHRQINNLEINHPEVVDKVKENFRDIQLVKNLFKIERELVMKELKKIKLLQ